MIAAGATQCPWPIRAAGALIVGSAMCITSPRAILGCGYPRVELRPSEAAADICLWWQYSPLIFHWLFGCQGGRVPYKIKFGGVIVVMFGRWRYMKYGPSTVHASFDFRGSEQKDH